MSVTSFANIFSQSLGCLFILVIVSFAVQKLLSRCYLFVFIFISIILGDGSKKDTVAILYQRVLCLCFPLGDSSVQSQI